MSQLDLVPTSPQNMAVKKNYWMPWKAVGKMNTSDSTSKLVTLELPTEKVASKELTRFQRLKQKVSAIRASVVAQAEAHPKIAAGLVGCVVAAAVWGVSLHMPHLGDVAQPSGEAPVKGDSNDSASGTDGTNTNAAALIKQKSMPTKMNWIVAGKLGVVLAVVLLARKAILSLGRFSPTAQAVADSERLFNNKRSLDGLSVSASGALQRALPQVNPPIVGPPVVPSSPIIVIPAAAPTLVSNQTSSSRSGSVSSTEWIKVTPRNSLPPVVLPFAAVGQCSVVALHPQPSIHSNAAAATRSWIPSLFGGCSTDSAAP